MRWSNINAGLLTWIRTTNFEFLSKLSFEEKLKTECLYKYANEWSMSFERFNIRLAWMTHEIELWFSGFTWTDRIRLTVILTGQLLILTLNSMEKFLAWFPRIENYLFWAILVEIRLETFKFKSRQFRNPSNYIKIHYLKVKIRIQFYFIWNNFSWWSMIDHWSTFSYIDKNGSFQK